MRRILLVCGLILSSLLGFSQGTVTTFPPLVNNNGSSGITFEVEASTPVVINDIKNLFNSGTVAAEVWYRIGGVQHIAGSNPSVTSANGWVQLFTGNVTGNGSSAVSITGMPVLHIPANTRVGIAIMGGLSYQTWTSTSQDVFTDNTFTIYTGQNIGYGGGNPSWPNHPREFLGSVTYALDVVGGCNFFTNFKIDSIGGTAAKVDWTPGTSTSSFFLEYGLSGFTPGTSGGTKITGTYPGSQPPVILTGLSAQTSYDLYFGEICNSGADSSYFPAPQSFTTTKLCTAPLNFTSSNVTTTSVDLNWTVIGSPTYKILYDTAGFDPNTSGNLVTATNPPYTLTGLSGATRYDIYLFGDCGSSGKSDTVGPVSIKTLCIPYTAPYSMDFDNEIVGQVPTCWAAGIKGVNAQFQNVDVYNFGSPRSAPNHLELYNYFTADTTMAISPQFTDLPQGDKQISFYAKTSSIGLQLIVGTMPNQLDLGQFHPIDTINLTNSYSNQYVYYLDSTSAYNGTDQYVAFLHGNSVTFSTIYIDDFKYEVIPPCPPPLQLSLLNVTDTTATFGFNAAGNNFNFIWGPTGFTQGSAGTGFAMGGNPFTIDSLLYPGGTFDVYVSTNCGVNGNSTYSGPLTFTTNCVSATLPFYESFNSWPLPCWDTTGGTDYWMRYAQPGGGYYIRGNYWSWSSGVTAFLTSQPITINKRPQIRFDWSHLYNSSYPNDRVLVRVEKNGNGIWDTVKTLIGPSFSIPGAGNTTPAANFKEEIIVLDSATYVGSTIKVQLFAISGFGPDVFLNDLHVEEVPACIPPTGLTVLGTSSGSAVVHWSPGGGSSWNVQYGPAGFNIGSGTAQTSGTTTDTIIGLSPNTTYEFYVQSDCVTDSSVWVGPKSFSTRCLAQTMPYTESFDSWPLACWDTVGGSAYWNEFVNTSGDNYAEANFWGLNGDSLVLTSPVVSITQDAQIRFDWSHLYNSFYPNDELMVRVQVAGSGQWDTVLSLKGATNFNDPTAGSSNTPGSFITEEIILDPAKYTNQDIAVELRANSDFGPDLFVNDFNIEAAPTCPKLFNLTATGIVDTAATVQWNASSTATSYQLWFGPSGFFQGTATVFGAKSYVTANSYLVDTLSPNTCYEFLVRAICSPGDSSKWVGPFSFCTPCSAFPTPYIESFDNLSTGLAGDLGNCWVGTGTTTTYSWQTNTGQTGSANTGPLGDNTSGSGVYLYTEASYGSPGDVATMKSPLFDVANLSNPEVRFSYHMYGSLIDTLFIDINDGSTWHMAVGQLNGQQQTSSSDPWRDTVIDISSIVTNTAQVRFRLKSQGCCAGDAAIDDFAIADPLTCPRPSYLPFQGSLPHQLPFSWVTGGASNWQMEYGPAGFTPGTGTWLSVTTNPYTITGLTSNTAYEAYLRDSCGAGDVSFWRGPFAFNTLCTPFNTPYLEDYDTWPLSCWDLSGGSQNWASSVGGGGYYAYANFWGWIADSAVMTSPAININSDSRIRFSWSHLYNPVTRMMN